MSNKNAQVSRKDFLKRGAIYGLAGAGAASALAYCGGRPEESADDGAGGETTRTACNDLSALSDQEKQQRQNSVQALQYVEKSPKPEQNCANCQFYTQPAGGGACGGCQLFPGPVAPGGWCSSWVKKAG